MLTDDIKGVLKNFPNITGLALDSRIVKPGFLFCAIPGEEVDGREFIPQAITKGASVILIETPFNHILELKVPYFLIPDLKQKIGILANEFYQSPSHALSVIGITGTNGKTSTSHFLAQIMQHKKCGLIGTVGKGLLPFLQPLLNTTPNAIDIQRYLVEFNAQNCQLVAMEVSSHALEQYRVNGIQFNTVVFTNLSHDHIDYHGSIEHYWQAKKKLFFISPLPKNMIINIDDSYGRELIQTVIAEQVIGYRIELQKNTPPLFPTIKEIVGYIEAFNSNSFVLSIRSPWGQGKAICHLLGSFNASNILAAVAMACIEGMPFEEVLAALPTINAVVGRMMCFGGRNHLPLVVVDFAHTPDALEKVLQALRSHCKGQLWCVFGCGGNRDRTKRPLMTKIAFQYSDKVILTQDNSRTEDPKQIFSDMLVGCKSLPSTQIEYDRTTAINKAITAAGPDDIVLVAGKGHEEYHLLGTEKIPYRDETVVQQALGRK